MKGFKSRFMGIVLKNAVILASAKSTNANIAYIHLTLYVKNEF